MDLDYSIYEETINKLNQKISNNPDNAALYLERAILRDQNFDKELRNARHKQVMRLEEMNL